MSPYAEVLRAANDIVLHNWPREDVPDTLVEAGYGVTVYGGPEPEDIYVHELRDGKVTVLKTGRPPEHADLIYVFPWPGFIVDRDLPWVVAEGKKIGASALWYQSGRASDGTNDPDGCWLPDDEVSEVRAITESAGLRLVHDAYIADAVRELDIRR